MIPKIIHFCWFSGDKYPELIENCINSWKRILPDYEFVLWDAERIKSCSNLWLEQTLEKRKYAFGADYVRFYALYHYGGVYLDADVEVLKSFNSLLDQNQFLGEEASGDIESAVLGTEKGTEWIKECLDHYADRAFVLPDGKFDMRPVPGLIGRVLKNHEKITVLPFTYFSPKSSHTQKISLKSHTFCIHHFDNSWIDKGLSFYIKKFIHKWSHIILGRDLHNKIVSTLRGIKK